MARYGEGETMSRPYKPFFGEIGASYLAKTHCELNLRVAVKIGKVSSVVIESLSRFYVVIKN